VPYNKICNNLCINSLLSLKGDDGGYLYELHSKIDNVELEYWSFMEEDFNEHLDIVSKTYPIYKLKDMY